MERNLTWMYLNNRGAMLMKLKQTIVNKLHDFTLWLLFKIFDLLFFEKEAEIDFFNLESAQQDYPDLFLEECLKKTH